MIASGAAIGMRRVDDLNESDDERIGYTMATIKNGQRVSSAHAFLHPVEKRPNLTIAVDSLATNLLFDGDAVVGVRVRNGTGFSRVPSAGSDPRARAASRRRGCCNSRASDPPTC